MCAGTTIIWFRDVLCFDVLHYGGMSNDIHRDNVFALRCDSKLNLLLNRTDTTIIRDLSSAIVLDWTLIVTTQRWRVRVY